jgi:hypothetical protein
MFCKNIVISGKVSVRQSLLVNNESFENFMEILMVYNHTFSPIKSLIVVFENSELEICFQKWALKSESVCKLVSELFCQTATYSEKVWTFNRQ